MKRVFYLSLCLGMALLPLPTSAQSGKSDSQTAWEKTLDAAKREGMVVVSIPTSAALRKQVEAAFHQRFDGIRLELVAARGSASVNRILEEKKAGVHYFDVHVGGTSSIVTGLLRAGVLEPVSPCAKIHLCFSRLFDGNDLVQLGFGQAGRGDEL